ncbi:hypothetical protein CRUP_001442 [Coryphaenoides rupestris]|nr:hypothetical protein CRUP_001442 [Coryphaenoides rupestris]
MDTTMTITLMMAMMRAPEEDSGCSNSIHSLLWIALEELVAERVEVAQAAAGVSQQGVWELGQSLQLGLISGWQSALHGRRMCSRTQCSLDGSLGGGGNYFPLQRVLVPQHWPCEASPSNSSLRTSLRRSH